ncbi:phosphoglycerate kinase [Patescibacteria group bacterium]
MSPSNIENIELNGQIVFLRCDLDFDPDHPNVLRLKVAVEAIKKCLEKSAKKVFIAGHRGREGDSLEGMVKLLSNKLGKSVSFADDLGSKSNPNDSIILIENLRKWKGEKEGDPEFASRLKDFTKAGVYINEAFAVSHRKHASVSVLPKLFEVKVIGSRFAQELEHLEKLKGKVKRPFIVVLGGAKKDKSDYIGKLTEIADKVLVGGRLPDLLSIDQVSVRKEKPGQKVIYADLNQDKQDITLFSVEVFARHIEKAKTIFVAGPMSKYEEDGQQSGTKRILEAIASTKAFKVAGGGDSENALKEFGFEDKFDWVSVGGGASLEFLTKNSLPALDALLD